MATEIEVKILEIDFPILSRKIEELGAKLKWYTVITTHVYDFPDRRLISDGGYVRIRNEMQDGEVVWHCTYKKKLSQAGAKIAQELDFQVNDSETARKFLEAIGLEQILTFEKKRWHFEKGDTIFDIDELPGIPRYLEIEAPSIEEIERTMDSLNIERSKAITAGPKELLALYGLNLDKIKELNFGVDIQKLRELR